jgi:NADH-ubiquinone oxidoreductase chain 5
MVGGLVVLAAITKRAQIPFSAWLPAAMAAPTPVSALVHSSTLVTAGVYLLIRFNYMLGLSNFLFYIGVFTIFMSGLGANLETDLKKIIALSTLSQLGLIIITLGLGMVEFSFFHLITHAMFKSLLFLCAGVFIHSMGDTQDIRHLGGAIVGCPLTSFYFIISSIALCGFPFFSGFYSKDFILEIYFIGGFNIFTFTFIILATFFTLTYSVRLIYIIFFKTIGVKTLIHIGEELGILVPMGVLLSLTLALGSFMRLNFFPLIYIYLPIYIKIIVFSGVIFLFTRYFSIQHLKTVNLMSYRNITSHFAGGMWFLPYLSSFFFMPSLKIGGKVLKRLDQGWLENLGGQGIFKLINRWGRNTDYFNSVNIKFYLFLFFLILLFLIIRL